MSSQFMRKYPMAVILLNLSHVFLFPFLLGGLLRWLIRKLRRPWLVTLAAGVLSCGLWAWASTIPIPGNEGPGICAMQAVCLTAGMLLTGLILRLIRSL